MEIAPGSQPLMQELTRPLKTGIDFADNGIIIEKQDVLQEIDQKLLL